MRRKIFYLPLSIAAIMAMNTAHAQSTASIEFEEVYEVKATSSEEGISGVEAPDSTKARGVINPDLIKRQTSGQSALNTINLLPSVNFTNSDAYGSSGGNLRIRGFDGSRISLTFDGFPLNDSGNYAIFSNQVLDPELIRSVNVNMGTTDVDSPTASAAGGTVNYVSLVPRDKPSGELNTSVGEYEHYRVFGMINTGVFTNIGTKAWLSASVAHNDKFKGPGEIFKQQYNGRIHQPIGEGFDFVSLGFHYNQNRNNQYRNPNVGDMRTLFGTTAIPGNTNVPVVAPLDLGTLTAEHQALLFQFENFARCTRTSGGPGAQNDNGGLLPNGTTFLPGEGIPSGPGVVLPSPNNILNTASCTGYAGVRFNPSNTGNLRLNSRFKLPANLTLTADAAYQLVLANGGGYSTLAENSSLAKGANTTGSGVDFNQDGDFVDTIGFYTPNNTNTNRYTLMTSLIWDPAEGHRLRLAYTFDLAQHRQTGEWGPLNANGDPDSVFGGRNGTGVFASDGSRLTQRDRSSLAMLNQIAGQYVGNFFDDSLRVEAGLRVPFFGRDLNQYCYTNTANGNPLCTTQPGLTIVPPTQVAPFPANSYFAPFTAKYAYYSILPNAGVRFKIIEPLSVFASFAQGFSAPRTDNLYRTPDVQIEPEKTNAVDGGLRFTKPWMLAQATGWYIGYQNRIVTSFDDVTGLFIDRNVGNVEIFGVDASAAVKPVDMATLMMFGSYTHGELKSDVQIGGTSTAPILAPTAGKRIVETPELMVGGRAEVALWALSVGAQGKWVGSRFATDVNDVIVPSYAVFDIDARLNFGCLFKDWGIDEAWFQVNASNVFNAFYFGSIGSQISRSQIGGVNGFNPNFSIGAPRTIQGSMHIAF